MTLGLMFWIIMLFCLLLGVYSVWPAANPRGAVGFNLALFFLLLLLGWAQFGPPIRG